jgi:hypothetical protein
MGVELKVLAAHGKEAWIQDFFNPGKVSLGIF